MAVTVRTPVVSTMQDAQLTIGSLLRHGQAVYADSRVRTFDGDRVREATYAEVGERAARLAGEELALAEAYGAPWPHGEALRVAALVGPPGRRRARLETAVTLLEQADASLDLARARVDLGAELRRLGERVAARAALSAGLAEAARCGGERVAALAREELGALGVRPTRAVAQGRALTPGERRVAELAADGLTNREIAQRLFVTEKTVETHLSATYRKLGLRTRRQLGRALAA